MNKIYLAIAGMLVALGLLFASHHPKPPNPNAVCHIKGVLPDPVCTPGVINPNVTQADIKTTICKTGWTATIRPPQSYTGPLKIQSIKNYGYSDTNTKHYEEDHFIPLELGGSPTDVKNLWAEPSPSPNPKDNVENILRSRVCNGVISLHDAQQKIITDWTRALQ